MVTASKWISDLTAATPVTEAARRVLGRAWRREQHAAQKQPVRQFERPPPRRRRAFPQAQASGNVCVVLHTTVVATKS